MKKNAGLIVFLLAVFALPAMAQDSAWQAADHVQARLLGGAAQPAANAALELQLGEGWHVFWRTPGDGGLPPDLDWSGSKNLAKIDVHWPLPVRFDTAGLYSFGYSDGVVLPLTVQPVKDGEPVTLGLKADIMVCKDICVPQKIALSLEIQPDGKSAYAESIADAMAKVPVAGEHPRLKIENLILGPAAVVVTAYSAAGFDNADLFVEAGSLPVTGLPEITVNEEDRRRAMIRIAAPEGAASLVEALADTPITLTLTNGVEAVEKTISFAD